MIPHERSLVKRLEGKPFALLGINSDQDRLSTLQRCRSEGVIWRNWFDGEEGPIAAAWNIRVYPAIYVLDHKGVIRFKNLSGEAMDKALDKVVDELLAKMEKSGAK